MAWNKHSLTSRTLRTATLRIGTVSLCVGLISYFLNYGSLKQSVSQQLILSTEQTLQRESQQFREIRELEQNFLREFDAQFSDPASHAALVRDFDLIFQRNADGSYSQRPGLFEGEALADGRRFPLNSATYAPDHPLNDDVKARFALSFLLSYKYGSTTAGRLFNFYGVVPEKGFPIHQNADIAKVFTYSGPDALRLEEYEFYTRGFASATQGTFLTKMYFDFSNNAWMTTEATPDLTAPAERRRILACVDVLLDDLMHRIARPAIQGAFTTIFLNDAEGTLIYHPDHLEEIKQSQGSASIVGLKIADDIPILATLSTQQPGKVVLHENERDIVAVGLLPETPWVLAIHYPKALMEPSILQNLAIVIALGLLTLLVEVFIIRAVLIHQVAVPLGRLVQATRQVGATAEPVGDADLPIGEQSEVGVLAREFHAMARRVDEARHLLEDKVRERTVALEEANRQLLTLSTTDGLTGVANRRRFDEVLTAEWRRSTRSQERLMLAMVDVDWFKKYNDHYGHPAGDDCLRTVARIIRDQFHRSTDFVARYGGEEFVVVCVVANADNEALLARKIHDALAEAALPHALSPFGRVTVSIGVACISCREDTSSPDQLVSAADSALYAAKNQGRSLTVLAAL